MPDLICCLSFSAVNKTFTKRINELSEDESESVLNYLFRLQHENHDAHVKYQCVSPFVSKGPDSMLTSCELQLVSLRSGHLVQQRGQPVRLSFSPFIVSRL